MAYVGGDILEVTYNHEIEGSGTIFCKSNEDGTLDPGGLRTNDDANSVTGNGRMINQMNRVLASFEGTIAWDMTDRDELAKLAKLAASPILADWTISSVSGAIWGGKGKPVGDIQGNTNTALIKLKLAFESQLKQIA
jgi:hypothetical protein